MTAFIVRYGIIGGVIVTIAVLWNWLVLTPGKEPVTGMVFGYLVMLVALTAVFLGIKAYRDKALGGAIRFMPAFALGLGISAVASLFYVVSWEICMAYSSYDFIAHYQTMMLDAAKAEGATPAQLQQKMAEAESFATMYRNPVIRMCFTFIEMFPVGILISLISAAVLRNSRVLPARAPG